MTTEVFDILSPILGDKVANAVIKHRKSIRKPLTPYAAELQVEQYIKTGDPIAAANMQILHGWQAIKADWYFNQLAKDKKTTEAVRPTFKSTADHFQSREEYLAYCARKNAPEPSNPDMLARLKQAGVPV